MEAKNPGRATISVVSGCLIAMSAMTCGPAWSLERYIGRAITSGGKVAYTETHWRYQRGGKPARLVLYRCPEGGAFARKEVVAVDYPWSPNFELIDGRDGYREGVRGDGTTRQAFWESSPGSVRSRTVQVSDSSIIDAGFDDWIRSNWTALMASKVPAQFLVPSKGRFLSVRVQRQPSGDSGTVKFRLGWDSWLGGMAPSVRLTYGESGRRLRVFEGIGTIRTADGDPWPVRIEFPPALLTSDASAAEVEAARGVPLNGRCG